MSPSATDRREETLQAAHEGRSLRGLRIVSLCTLGSRVLGLVRDMLMAASFGSGPLLDAFTVAFRIPNMARRLFGDGAVSTAFLPVFVNERETRGEQASWRLATAVFIRLALLLSVIVLLGELLVAAFLGWGDPSAETRVLIELLGIMLPYLLLICLAALLCAMLHGLEHFTWPALVPVVLNVVWIVSLLFLVPRWTEPTERMRVVAITIVVAGLLQLFLTGPELFRRGLRLHRSDPHVEERVRSFVRAMVPICVGLSITQMNSLTDSLFAWFFAYPATASNTFDSVIVLGTGTATALYLGQRMYQFPLSVFGIALGTVLYPRFARHAAQRDESGLQDDVLFGLRMVLAIGLPASLGLVLLAEPATDLLFRYGEFSRLDAIQTSRMIVAYGAGVWAFCGVLILNRVFYALNDRQSPLRIGLFAVVVNLPLNLLLASQLGGHGLAWATSVTGIIQLAWTLAAARRVIGRFPWHEILGHSVRVMMASLLMLLVGWVVLSWFSQSPEAVHDRVVRLVAPLLASLAAYAVACRLFRIPELSLLWHR